MNDTELRTVIEGNEEVIAQTQAQIDSLRQHRAEGVEYIARLRRGDDLRQILIDYFEKRQDHWDKDILALDESIRSQLANMKRIKESIRG